MKVKEEEINKVLALFDEEDIPYIDFDHLIDNDMLENNKTEKSNSNVKVKKIGGRNDRRRK